MGKFKEYRNKILKKIKDYFVVELIYSDENILSLSYSTLVVMKVIKSKIIGGLIFDVKYIPPFTKIGNIRPRPYCFYIVCCREKKENPLLLNIAYNLTSVDAILEDYEAEYNNYLNTSTEK